MLFLGLSLNALAQAATPGEQAWVLYEQGTLTSVVQFAGSVLVLCGLSIVLVALLLMGTDGRLAQ